MAITLAIIRLLAALFRAFPTFEKLVECALDYAASANVADAIARKQKKDAAVDAAVDGKEKNDCKND